VLSNFRQCFQWGGGRENTNNNVTNQEVDRKENVLATFLLAMYAATTSFMDIIYHNPQLNVTKRTFARSLILYRNSE